MTNKQICSFCSKHARDVGPLVEADASNDKQTIYICLECAHQCIDLLMEKSKDSKAKTQAPNIFAQMASVPSAKEVYDHLSDYVIGQDRAKKTLSVQVVQHYRRLIDNQLRGGNGPTLPLIQAHGLQDIEIDKSNIILIGPTGSGKTFLAKSIAKKLSVPFAIGDATTITEAGYVGEDVENLLLKLLNAADDDVEATERGIIYIDEIDKLAKSGGNVSITRDVSGEGVQQSLLKLVEGTISSVPPNGGRKHPEQQYIQVDTTNILFICGGAFVGLEEIIAQRVNKRRMGFNSDSGVDKQRRRTELLRQCTADDLIQYGMIPELVGRLPIIAVLEELTEDDMVRVLKEPKNALLKQEQKKMAYEDVQLEFTEGAVREIARKAKDRGTGARALRSVVEEFMLGVHFDLPKGIKSITITEDVVKGLKSPFDKKDAA